MGELKKETLNTNIIGLEIIVKFNDLIRIKIPFKYFFYFDKKNYIFMIHKTI